MHGRHGFGRGRGGGRRRLFFLESSLLVLLLRKSSYGYSLIDGLEEFGFPKEYLDVSIVYRALRELEAANLVSDQWDNNSQGPPRRIYTITETGLSALEEWMENLRQNRLDIERLEAAYKAARGNR